MVLLRTPPLPHNAPRTSCVGVWWYDPDRRLALSFLEDPQAILADGAKERRAVSGRPAAQDPPVHPRQSHAELWPRLTEMFPEYASLRFTADEENAERLAFLSLPRGRIVYEDGGFVLLCPPSMAGDATMVNLVMRDYSLLPSRCLIAGDEHYAPESPDLRW